MGNITSCTDSTLLKGWTATIEEYVKSTDLKFAEWGRWTLDKLKDAALMFARAVDITQDGTIWVKARQFARDLLICKVATCQDFVRFSELVLKMLVEKVLLQPAVIDAYKEAIQECMDEFLKNVPALCNDAFICMLKSAKEELEKYAVGSLLPSVVTSVVAGTAKRVFPSSVIVNVGLLALSGLYSKDKLNQGIITQEQHNKHMTKRAAATGGSIAGSTAGAALGSLIFPGVGTIVGGIVGGMLGDYYGSNAGEAIYEHKQVSHSHPE